MLGGTICRVWSLDAYENGVARRTLNDNENDGYTGNLWSVVYRLASRIRKPVSAHFYRK